jgi:superfamily II DNA/RNA helicase
MNGNLSPRDRKRNLNDFKNGVYPVMVSTITNVTAREIDFEEVTHFMIDNNLPQNPTKLLRLKEILVGLLGTAEETFLDHKCWQSEQGPTEDDPSLKDYLLHVLGSCSDKKILVFVETKKSSKEMAHDITNYLCNKFKGRFREKFQEFCHVGDDDDLNTNNFGAIHVNNDLSHYNGEKNQSDYKDGIYPIMVSTNLATRGIDIEGVTHVINFDLPQDLGKLCRLKMILLDLLVTAETTFLEHKCWEREPGRSGDDPCLKDYMLHVLGSCSDKKILIFVETKVATKEIAENVSEFLHSQFRGRFRKKFKKFCHEGDDDDLISNFGAIHMNGDLSQYYREKHLNDFKDGVYPVMVSTNVTARGIDIEGVTHVINFDLPQDLGKLPKVKDHDSNTDSVEKPNRNQFEEYIHRIGRTGRAGNTGEAISFFQGDRDQKLAICIVKMLTEAEQDVPKWLEDIARKQPRDGRAGAQGPGTVSSEWNEVSGPGVEELWGNEL